MKEGLYVYSPIVHSHHLSVEFDPKKTFNWMPLDIVMLDASDAAIIFMIDGWDISKGVTEEIEFIRNMGKSIIYSKEAWPGYDHTTLNKSF